MTVPFKSTSFGPGSMTRFKSLKSHRWEYAIYRGVEKVDGRAVAYTFSDYPLGPITRWLGYWPEFIECAITPDALKRESVSTPKDADA